MAHVQLSTFRRESNERLRSGSTEVTTARWEVTHAPPGPGAKVMTRSPAR